MTADKHLDEPGRTVFGAAAEAYDAGRPGYHPALVAEVLTYADASERTAVEIGAGTGKATVLFAASGVAVTCLEPDTRMAEVLRRNTAAFPGVSVEVTSFESWERSDRHFGMLLAATSWHWVHRSRRWTTVADALHPGGTVALFWNPQGVLDPDLHADLSRIDARHGLGDSPHSQPAPAYGPEAGDWGAGGRSAAEARREGLLRVDWPAAECRDDPRFEDLREVRLREETHYDTDRYLKFLESVSTYRVLPDDRRRRALAETAAALIRHGGGIDMLHVTDLFLARRAFPA
jgi:hypothetical protein